MRISQLQSLTQEELQLLLLRGEYSRTTDFPKNRNRPKRTFVV